MKCIHHQKIRVRVYLVQFSYSSCIAVILKKTVKQSLQNIHSVNLVCLSTVRQRYNFCLKTELITFWKCHAVFCLTGREKTCIHKVSVSKGSKRNSEKYSKNSGKLCDWDILTELSYLFGSRRRVAEEYFCLCFLSSPSCMIVWGQLKKLAKCILR